MASKRRGYVRKSRRLVGFVPSLRTTTCPGLGLLGSMAGLGSLKRRDGALHVLFEYLELLPKLPPPLSQKTVSQPKRLITCTQADAGQGNPVDPESGCSGSKEMPLLFFGFINGSASVCVTIKGA